MAQRQANLGRTPDPGGAKRRARVPALVTGLMVVIASGWVASLLVGVPAMVWLADAVSPSADAQSVPPPSSPSKEYIYAGGRLVATEEPADDAAFVSQSVPTSMTAGQPYSVSVTMRNTGTSTWAAATNHKLGWQNSQNNTWGISRVNLPSSVSPGGEATFSFNVTAPATPGTYNFQWSMVRDGVAWFGALSAPKSVTVSAPAGGSLSGTFAAQTAAVNLTAEGTQDWAHWGHTSAASFDHKAGVASQISNYTVLGAGAAYRFGDLSYAHSWSDGTPTPSATTITGVAVSGAEGNGFRLTVPADTSTRTLRLYVGAWYAQGQLQAQLSDGSAATFTDVSVNATAGTTNYVYTITYKASSPGQTLTLSYTIKANYNAPYGNVTLQAATLMLGTAPPLPANGSAFVSQSVPTSMIAGQVYSVSVTMRNTGANMWVNNNGYNLGSQNPQDNTTWGMARVALPSSTISGGQATFTFTVRAPTTPGTYNFQWRMVQDPVEWLGAYTTNVPVTVSASGSGGTLGGGVTAAPSGGSVNLTAEGAQDWAHWGLNAAGSFDYKAGVGRPISNYTILGASPAARFADLSYTHAWSDGTPTASAATNTGVYISGAAGNGFQITAPADTSTRTLRLYVGAWYADGQLQAQLSDGSAATFTDASVSAVTGTSNYVYTITYKASAAAQVLTVSYTIKTNRYPPYGNVTLQAATLAQANPPPEEATSQDRPTGLVATATGATTVALTWTASPGSVSGYVVERAQAAGAFAALTPGTTTTSFTDTTASPDTAYLYRVKAVFAGGGASGYSNQDVATTVIFTDGNPLQPGVPIRARHLNELRRAVNAVRALVGGLGPAAYTHLDPVSDPPAQRRRIYLADVTELRARLDEALGPLGLLKPYPAEPALAQGSPVRAAHFEQLRERVR